MNTYIVILKLASNEDLYLNLVVFLKSRVSWARPTPGTWIIKTANSAGEIRDAIKSRIGTKDSVLIVKAGGAWATSSIPKAVTDWMKEHL